MRAAPVALLFSGLFASATDLAPEVLLLQRARVVMSNNLARLPNYTCMQTIERFVRPAPNKKPRVLDVVRLEVALADGRELFAWPGSGRFSESEIGDIVKGGAIGNGAFALHAKAIFLSKAPRFTYTGQIVHENRRVHKWDYVVSQFLSGWTVRVGDKQAVVGYHGSVLVDAQTIDLVRFDVAADDIPPHLLLTEASMGVEYSRMDIGGQKFLLPVRGEMGMTATDGTENSNRMTFSRCQQYSGESKLFFDEPLPEETRAQGPVKVIDAPRGLLLHLDLAAPVVFKGAATGDPVTAKLATPLKLPDGVTLPKGALVHGRLMSLRDQQYVRDPGRAVGLKFFEIEATGIRVRMSATLEEVRTAQPGFRQYSSLGPTRPENESITGSVFFVHANILQLPRGLRTVWRTKTLEAEDNQ